MYLKILVIACASAFCCRAGVIEDKINAMAIINTDGVATNLTVHGVATVSDTMMIGSHARLVATTNGVRLEVLSGTNWIEQVEWSE